jgi:hypothetical protein
MIEAYNNAPEDPDMLDAVTAEDGEGGEEEDAENDETVAAERGQVFPF